MSVMRPLPHDAANLGCVPQKYAKAITETISAEKLIMITSA